MNFKLIGINVLNGCHSTIRKTLKEDQFYCLYSTIDTIKNDRGSLIDITLKKDQNLNSIYSNSDVDISISAVVGKNGSGKSAFFEFIYACSYLLGTDDGTLDDIKWRSIEESIKFNFANKQEHKGDYKSLKQLALFELYFLKGRSVYKIVNNGVEDLYIAQKNDSSQPNGWQTVKGRKILASFYSICINYSLYGLNENFAPWLQRLFHKNDGYKTPIVINPYRTEGSINVSNEIHLNQTRTLFNLINSGGKSIQVNNKKVTKVRMVVPSFDGFSIPSLGLQNSHFNTVLDSYKKINNHGLIEFFERISKSVCGIDMTKKDRKSMNIEQSLSQVYELRNKLKRNSLIYTNERYKFELIKYVFKKLYKICHNYPSEYSMFITYFEEVPRINLTNELLEKLSKDRSHITLKLRQAICMFHSNFSEGDFYEVHSNDSEETLNYIKEWNWNDFKKLIISGFKKHKNSKNSLSDFIPLAYSRLVIVFEGKESTFGYNDLSSGEQQLQNVIQTIIYHLYNLESVHLSDYSERIKYDSVNILLDEIELCLHPDFQRKFIYELVKSIRNLKLNKISGLNLIFSTHSPFILSDIPANNILHLDQGIPVTGSSQTFGNNINELLANDFFLSSGYMGEFARLEINKVTDYLSLTSEIKDLESSLKISESKETKKKLIDLKIHLLEGFDEKYNQDYCKRIIEITGESILKFSLLELYCRAYKQDGDNLIKSEIERLSKMLDNK